MVELLAVTMFPLQVVHAINIQVQMSERDAR